MELNAYVFGLELPGLPSAGIQAKADPDGLIAWVDLSDACARR